MYILITGCGGFIGFHLTLRLLKNNKKIKIIGIDNLNLYYSKKLKDERVKILKKNSRFKFIKFDLINKKKLSDTFIKYKFKYVVHLAAQAGVRYSFSNPEKYINSNILAFNNIIELCRINQIENFFFASSSSIYGNQNKFPIKEKSILEPVSFYGTTKYLNEIIASSYSKNYSLKSTALRFFTVYGPYGRPDMALYKFVDLIKRNKKIDLFNYGNHMRDFSYIDDIIEAVIKIIKFRLKINDKNNYMTFNLARGRSQKLINFIKEIELNLKIKAKINNIKFQRGDVLKTHADISKLKRITNYKAKIDIKEGIKNFIAWHNSYHKIK